MYQDGQISVKPENIFPIIRQWLYSEQEIFLRELVANAVDATSKFQFMVATGATNTNPDQELCVEISLDAKAKTLKFIDYGIGMTATEINKYINEIAYSGLIDFVSQVEAKGVSDTQIIGHFGLGFYSAFMVADCVEIDTLSYTPDAKPARWSSTDGINYQLEEGTLAHRGTVITLYLNEEAAKTYTASKLRSLINRYCGFMALPIYLAEVKDEDGDKDKINANPERVMQNEPNPLWRKNTKDISDEEANAFYRKTFGEPKDPVFWLHLNLDYPLRLQGLLFFPSMGDARDVMDGCIKMYANQVFVADNMKELLPEHLFMLKGCLDCPDLPLNVSRSFLQTDATVQKMSSHIIRKVAERLAELVTKERERYEKLWDNIRFFVEIVTLRDEAFAKKVRPALLFSTISGKKLTLDELGEGKHPYVNDANSYAPAVKVAAANEVEVLLLDNPWSSQLIALIEHETNEEHTFLRIDEWLKRSSDEPNPEHHDLPSWLVESLSTEFASIEQKPLGQDAPLSLIVTEENVRRMAEWQKMMQQYMPDTQDSAVKLLQTLLLNSDHALIKALLTLNEIDKRTEVACFVRDQARLYAGELKGEALLEHIARQERMALGWLEQK